MAGKRQRRGRKANGNGNNGKANGKKMNQPSAMVKENAPLMGATSFLRSSQNQVVHLTGRDFVSRLTVKPSSQIVSASDSVLLVQAISASSFPGTRLTQLSQLWERYRWTQAVLEYVPAVPNTLACQLIAYIDTDPNDDPTTVPVTDDLIRQAVAQVGSRQWNFNQRMDIPLIVRKDDQLYYTGKDDNNKRFSLQGVLYIIQVTNLIDFNGGVIANQLVAGSLYLRWGCNFSMPQINPEGIPVLPSEISLKFIKQSSGATDLIIGGLEVNRDYVLAPSVMEYSYDVAAQSNAAKETSLNNAEDQEIIALDSAAVYEAPDDKHVVSVTYGAIPEKMVVNSGATGTIVVKNPSAIQITVAVYTYVIAT